MDKVYNKKFYESCCGDNYDDTEHWTKFFGRIARNIVDLFSPKTVLDAGCAYGYLVKELRDLGVEAYGFDISEFAISQADESIRPYVAAHSVTEKLPDNFPDKFDLVITIEVLEHILPLDGEKAIKNLCSYSDTVIFTSTPSDLNNRTHVNVQQQEYWAKIFAANSFFHDLTCPVDFICPWAMLFRRKDNICNVVFDYEMNRRIDKLNFEEQLAKTEYNTARIYFDFGNGFTDTSAESFTYGYPQLSSSRIALPSGCKRMRFDLEEKYSSTVSELIIVSGKGSLAVTGGNYSRMISGSYYFQLSYPQLIVDIPSDAMWIEIYCAVSSANNAIEQNAFCKLIKELEQTEKEKKTELEQAEKEKKAELEQAEKEKRAELEQAKKEKKAELEQTEKEKRAELERAEKEKKALLDDCRKKEAEWKEQFRKSQKELDSLLQENSEIKSKLKEYMTACDEAVAQRNKTETKNELMNTQLLQYSDTLSQMRSSRFWKMTAPARKVADILKMIFRPELFRKGIISLRKNGVKETLQKVERTISNEENVKKISCSMELSEADREEQQKYKFDRDIKISILVPLYNTPIEFLEGMISSVTAQTYGNWELCLADGSDKEHRSVGSAVKKLAAKDKRIRYKKLDKNLGISENTNACIDMASGDYIALFDHDDLLHPEALFDVMKAICEKNADFVYTDEAVFESPDITKITNVHFKPDYAIDTLRSNNYICHFSVFSRELLTKAGRFRSECDGSQDHDLILRLTHHASKVIHIPKVLYFWRSHPLSVAQDIDSKPYVGKAGQKAVSDSITKMGLKGTVESSAEFPSIYRIRYDIHCKDKVSIIIAVKNHYDRLVHCIDSIYEKTAYENFEIIIIDTGAMKDIAPGYQKKIMKHKHIKVISADKSCSYSASLNKGALAAEGRYYLFLNYDTQIIESQWIEELMMYVQREDVGAAGGLLYYTDDTVRHAGIVLGMGKQGTAGRSFYRCPKQSLGYMGRMCYAQNVTAVSAEMMLVKKTVFWEVRGFDEEFSDAYGDIDFCMRIRAKGYLIVWTPYAKAYHLTSPAESEKASLSDESCERFRKRWKKELEQGDPYFNPNFLLDREDFYFI